MADVAEQAIIDAGTRFATALAGKRSAELAGLLAPEVDFRGLTPGRAWEASGREQVIEILLGSWFEPTDVIEELLAVDTSTMVDRRHVSYRLRGHNADGPFVVEQQMYFMTDGADHDADHGDDHGADHGGDHEADRISWMRVLCSGFRTPAA